MTLVLIILLGGGYVGGLVLRKQAPAVGTGILIVCSLLSVALATGRIVATVRGPPTFASMVSELAANNRAMAHELGRYLMEEKAGTGALCVLEPSDQNADAIRAGLEQSLGNAIPVEFVVLGRRDHDEALDILVLTPDCLTDLLICMTGSPWSMSGELAAILQQRNVRVATGSDCEPLSLGPYVRAGVFAGGAAFRDEPQTVKSFKKASTREIFEA